ncbi:hypothetical protein P8C59_007653 [Phyllachora maydis]|uniref:Uncharacterized protein n=1 Tax=Phyllachora maydis TaxID=1825666 RepID=A0AAD9MFS6_9PEZI|nr:hypothetical protein P8C59_007653 [Phyllachora maydis]
MGPCRPLGMDWSRDCHEWSTGTAAPPLVTSGPSVSSSAIACPGRWGWNEKRHKLEPLPSCKSGQCV